VTLELAQAPAMDLAAPSDLDPKREGRNGMAGLVGKKAVVVGASRGLGRGIGESLGAAGASVLAIVRERAGLDDLKGANPATALGLAAVRSYAARAGMSEEQFGSTLGAPVTPEGAGAAFLALATRELDGAVAYTLTGDGLIAIPATV
jgi:NAD(P)-dependent dehydrogenase (short-subunit alcohol dehydrogenase family)